MVSITHKIYAQRKNKSQILPCVVESFRKKL